jgi:hypothetical protein
VLRGHDDAGRIPTGDAQRGSTPTLSTPWSISRRACRRHAKLQRDPRFGVAVSDPSTSRPGQHYQLRGAMVEMTSEGGVDSIEALSQKYTGGPYAWYGGRDQVRLIVKIDAQHVTSTP